MAETVKIFRPLGDGQLKLYQDKILIGAENARYKIENIIFYNTHSSAVIVSLYSMRDGINARLFLYQSIAATSTFVFDTPFALEFEDTLEALADTADKVNYFINGTQERLA